MKNYPEGKELKRETEMVASSPWVMFPQELR